MAKKEPCLRIDLEDLPEGCDRTNVMTILVKVTDNNVSRSIETDPNTSPHLDIWVDGGNGPHIATLTAAGYVILQA